MQVGTTYVSKNARFQGAKVQVVNCDRLLGKERFVWGSVRTYAREFVRIALRLSKNPSDNEDSNSDLKSLCSVMSIMPLRELGQNSEDNPCVPRRTILFCNLLLDNANPIVDVWVGHNALGKKTPDDWILRTEELLRRAQDAVNLGKCLAVGGFKMYYRCGKGVLSTLPIRACVPHCPSNGFHQSSV